jgi:hypothetical protein
MSKEFRDYKVQIRHAGDDPSWAKLPATEHRATTEVRAATMAAMLDDGTVPIEKFRVVFHREYKQQVKFLSMADLDAVAEGEGED